MNETKVKALITSIDGALRKLAEETGAEHIDAFFIKGNTSVDDYTDTKNPKFTYFKTEKGEHFYHE